MSTNISTAQVSKFLAGLKAYREATQAAAKVELEESGLNEMQLLAVKKAKALFLNEPGAIDFILTGAAGTGKTTTLQAILEELALTEQTMGSVRILSFTNKAIGNVAKKLPLRLRSICQTAHSFLEFKPEFFTKLNAEGDIVNTMRFIETRNASNPVIGVSLIIFEESSTLDIPLFNKICDAAPEARFMFVGDIHQLPPIFGRSILEVKSEESRNAKQDNIVRLSKVYRQALKSPIIKIAHRILEGKPIPKAEAQSFECATEHGELKFSFYAKKISADIAIARMGTFFSSLIEQNKFKQEEDIILIPNNVGFGSIELGKILAQKFGELRNAIVHEVICGFTKQYLAEGDLVLCNKENYRIKSIEYNSKYYGVTPKQASTCLSRWGLYSGGAKEIAQAGKELNLEDVHANPYGSLEEAQGVSRVNAASHIITLVPTTIREGLTEKDVTITLSSGTDIAGILSADCISVHKSQGSEYNKVYFLLHNSHYRGKLICRELLYTAVTRAKNSLHVICEADSFEVGVTRKAVRG